MVYILKKLWQYKKILVLLMVLGTITQSIMRYLWSYIAKYVIEIVQAQEGLVNKDIAPLIKL